MRPPLALHVGPLEDGQLAWGLGQTSRGFLWTHHGPQSPRVWHTVPAMGHPELRPTAKAAWRTGCSQSGTSEQEPGVALRDLERAVSEARSGWVSSLHCKVPSNKWVVAWGAGMARS